MDYWYENEGQERLEGFAFSRLHSTRQIVMRSSTAIVSEEGLTMQFDGLKI
jgi:hypothetical protein